METPHHRIIYFEDFSRQFGKHPVPDVLQQLFVLQEAYDYNVADGFYLWNMGHSFPEDMFPGLNQHFIEFARANGTGSVYAIWITAHDLTQCPIAVFGDEGGCYIIARNMAELIQLLTFDTEIFVIPGYVYFHKDVKNLAWSKGHYGLIRWAKEKLGIDPITTDEQAEAIVKNAQAAYQASFLTFLKDHGVDLNELE